MANYYEELVEKIKRCINEEKYIDAKKMIDEELSMPYTPKSTLEVLNQLGKEIQSHLTTEKKQTFKSEEEILNDLLSGSEKAMSALEALALSNIRSYLPMIEDLLNCDKINHILKCLIFEILIDQKVDEVIHFKKGNEVILVNPIQLKKVFELESFNNIASNIEQITLKNPSFTKQCIMVLSNVLYDIYPNDIQIDEYEKYCFSIIKYVYKAYDDLDGFNKLAKSINIDTNNLIDFQF